MEIDGHEVVIRRDCIHVGCVEVSRDEIEEVIIAMDKACGDETFADIEDGCRLYEVDIEIVEEGPFKGYGLKLPSHFVTLVDEYGQHILTTKEIAKSMGYDC